MGDYELVYPSEELLEFESPIPQAASWLITEKLIRECDDVFLTWSNTPEGGGYDTLHVNIRHQDRELEVLLNRAGSLHINGEVRGGNIARPGVWVTALTHEGRARVIRDIYVTLGIEPNPTNTSTPDSIMCRVVGQALLQAVPFKGVWTTFAAPPSDSRLIAQVSSQREFSQLLNWVLARNYEPIARFQNGWMWLASGDRVDLFSQYRAGRSVQSLAALVHGDTGVGRFPAPPDPQWS